MVQMIRGGEHLFKAITLPVGGGGGGVFIPLSQPLLKHSRKLVGPLSTVTNTLRAKGQCGERVRDKAELVEG